MLDIACGEGYGSNIMADAAKEVVGIDLDEETINEARLKYKKPNIRYLAGSATKIPIAENYSFDLIISFETLEHIDEQEQVAFLKEVKRLLKPEGVFVVSTPDRNVYGGNPFHKKEFTENEFVEFIKSYFKYSTLFGQKSYFMSYIFRENSVEPIKECRVISGEKNRLFLTDEALRPTLLLALCSDREAAIATAIQPGVLLDVKDSYMGKLRRPFMKKVKEKFWRTLLGEKNSI